MTKEIKRELSEITDVVLSAVEANGIYLFGSFAYGTPDENSDIDIYVVIPDGEMRELDAIKKIRLALCKVQKRPLDILAGRESKFNERKILPTIERTIAEKGILLYEKSRRKQETKYA